MQSGIYQLTFPNGKFYVGSSKHVPKRLMEHRVLLQGRKHYNRHLQNTFNKHGDYLESILIECSEIDLLFFEQVLIDTFDPVLNVSRIAGKVEFTSEVREKMRAAKAGVRQDPLIVERRAAKIRGRARPPAVRAAISAAHKGVPKGPNPKLGALMRERHAKGLYLGRKCSDETRERLREGQARRWSRPEEIEKAKRAARCREEEKRNNK
jgi:group I intron endonuclease